MIACRAKKASLNGRPLWPDLPEARAQDHHAGHARLGSLMQGVDRRVRRYREHSKVDASRDLAE